MTRIQTHGRRTLIMLALVCAAPVVASYAAYYWWRPSGRVNYGELLDPKPVAEISGRRPDGAPFRVSELRGRWVLLIVDGVMCEERCQRKLYATRQAQTIQGREQGRVVRVLVQPSDAAAPAAEWLVQHPGMIVAHGDADQWNALPGGATHSIYLIDPLGNLLLRYPADADIKLLAKDLERLLLASRIG